MKNIVKDFLNQIKEDKHKRRRSYAVMFVLSMLVASSVLWQMKLTGITMTGEALCGYLQHEHTTECRGMKVACGLEESQEHQHNDECKQEAYVCGYEEEHAHTLLCYSDASADLETSSDWELTIQALNANPAEDLAMVARSQIGYTESQRNYKVAEDGVAKRGYTRYGEWYGNPYGDWNAMFVSFCLNYAQHPAYETLKNSGVESMRVAAENAGVYQTASAAVPSVGDLVFLDKDSNGNCDTVAIVADREEGAMTLVEGDCGGAVAENKYSLDNGTVLGYALLTAQPRTADELPDTEPTTDPTEGEGTQLTNDSNITVTFVINNDAYTQDPTSTYTHVILNLTAKNTAAAEGYSVDGGLTYEYWTSEAGRYKHKVTGKGTLMTRTIPAGTTLENSGYDLPNLSSTNITNNNQYSYLSAYSWVTDEDMICNDDTVFTEDTTLYLRLYTSEEAYTLNWVCNCGSTDGGSHSVYFNLSSLYPNPTFALGQSLSANYILSAEDVNRTYTGTDSCNVGSSNNKVFTGWFMKTFSGDEIDFGAGVPISPDYTDTNAERTVKVYARWEEKQTPVTVTAIFVNGTETVAEVPMNSGDALGDNLPTVTVPDDKIFLGWQIGDTGSYADANTTITVDTTYTAVFANKCTVTFKNGETLVETRELAENSALGTLPEGPVVDGKTFLGWKNVETDEYATAETVITASTDFTAHIVDNVTVIFKNNGEQYGEALTVPVGTVLWNYLPAEVPEYTGESENEMVFAGWQIGDTEDVVKEDTLVAEGMILHAVFKEVPHYNVYLHDIAPDGVTDYELDGLSVSISQTFLPEGTTLAQWLEEDAYAMVRDDVPASACIWYTKQETDGVVTYVPYDLNTPITSTLDIYTFNYSVTLTRTAPATTTSFLNLFPVASAAQVTVSDDGNTLTMILREGEKPPVEKFVVGGVDYSAYDWSFTDESGNAMDISLADIMANGVTKNIEATAAADDFLIKDTATAKVRFQVIVNEQLMDLGEQDVTIYLLKGEDSYSISQDTFLEVYKDFGFSVEEWVQNVYSLPQKVDPDPYYWANHPLRVANGVYYNPSVGEPTSTSAVLYLPGNSAMINYGNWGTYQESQSFYTVTVTDPERVVYQTDAEIPAVQYVFTGNTATVTLPKGDTAAWTYTAQSTGTDRVYESVAATENADGTVTYTFTNVTGPITLTPKYGNLTSANKKINFYVYIDDKPVLVESGSYTVYSHDGKHWLSAGRLEAVYGDYGFTADQLNEASRYFPHTDAGSDTVWSDRGPVELDGLWFSPILNSDNPNNCDVYYAPGYTAGGSANNSALASHYSFYTVTVTDPENRVYAAGEVLPATQIVYRKNSATVTVKNPPISDQYDGVEEYCWVANGKMLKNGVNNGDGTTTYTIENVMEPIVVSPIYNFATITVQDDNHLIYADGTTLPSVTVVRGSNGQITVDVKSGYSWVANGEGILQAVYNEDGTQVTYIFNEVTEDIILTPVEIQSSFQISYDINLGSYNPTSTRPTIVGSNAYTETYNSDSGNYIVKSPEPRQFTITNNNSLYTVVFQGWKIVGTDVTLQEGMVTAAELSQYGSTINLQAVWKQLDHTHSVTFYINLELLTEKYDNSTTNSIVTPDKTPNGNYTESLYGTEISIDECPTCDGGQDFQGGDVISEYIGETKLTLADVDAVIRDLPNGVTAKYMYDDRLFTLGGFPTDDKMIQKIAEEQAEMIEAFHANTNEDYHVEGDPTNVTAYRAVGTYDDRGVFHPTYRIICTRDTDGQLRYVPATDINTEDYAVRWYVLKYEGNGWHIDGVLVKKRAQLTVTKTFYGDDDAVDAVKDGGYAIDVVGINEANPGSLDGRPLLYTLTLKSEAQQTDNSETTQIEQGYKAYDPTTDTYTWVINLTADWKAWLYERNYIHGANDSSDSIVTLSEYAAYNFTETPNDNDTTNDYNRSRTVYNDADGVLVATKAHALSDHYRTYETVAFYNTYLPSAAVPISKVDDNGKPLTGVSFTLTGKNNNNETVSAKIWMDSDGVYYYHPDSVQKPVDPSWRQVDVITVDDSGYALVMGLKDAELNYSFELMETSTPQGYNAIGIPIGFTIAGDGSIQLKQAAQESGMVSAPDNNTIRVTNTSKLMSVTVVKDWGNDPVQNVTLQLTRDGVDIPGKVVVLDGTEDTPAADQTDGYEVDSWKVTWNNLPVYAGGVEAVYSVKELKIGETNYDATDLNDGYPDYHVKVVDMQYTARTDDGIPTAAEIKVINGIQRAGLEFIKTDEIGNPLAGATFQLYTDPDCKIPYGNPQTSADQTGEVYFGNLAPGTYYMKETVQPAGYQKNDTIYTVTVRGGKTILTAYGESIDAIPNESNLVTLQLQKIDAADNSELSGAVFAVWKMDPLTLEYKKIERTVNGEVVNTFAVDADGKLIITDLSRGNYKLTEVSAPDGYYRMTEEIFFTVEKGVINCDGKSNDWTFKNSSFTVKNEAGSELPHTGGVGTHFGTMAGLLMMASSLLYGFLLRRKRERGAV